MNEFSRTWAVGRQSAVVRLARCVLAVFVVVTTAACDSHVGGVRFESGFGVSREQAFREGFLAAQRACETNTGQLVKYKSGTAAEAAWVEGHYGGLATFCPHRM